MAQVLASLYGVTSELVSLEYGYHEKTAALFCRARRPVARIIERQLAAAYPDLLVERIDEALTAPPAGAVIKTIELRLVGDVMPIETCDAFEDRLSRELNDPIAGLLGLLAAGPQISVQSHVAIQLLPVRRRRTRVARRVLNRYYKTKLHTHHRRGDWYLNGATSPSRICRAIARFLAAIAYPRKSLPPIESKVVYARLDQALYTARINLMAAADSEYAAQHQLDQLAAAFAPFAGNSPAHFRAVTYGKNRRGSAIRETRPTPATSISSIRAASAQPRRSSTSARPKSPTRSTWRCSTLSRPPIPTGFTARAWLAIAGVELFAAACPVPSRMPSNRRP